MDYEIYLQSPKTHEVQSKNHVNVCDSASLSLNGTLGSVDH